MTTTTRTVPDERFRPLNLKPMPHQISDEYNRLHGQLCEAQREIRLIDTDLGLWIGQRQTNLSRRRYHCDRAADALSDVIGEASKEKAEQEQAVSLIQAELDRLFAVWCAKRGTDPAVYVEELKGSY